MTRPELTCEQRSAAQYTGQDVVVSAAAGSGKTRVLSDRCAYLVCHAPTPLRCQIQELLVVTFTDAAAGEMRARIREALRAESPENQRSTELQRQLLLLDHAHISTIHAFCRWLLRQNFMRADLDPNAVVLDAEDAALLLDDCASELLRERLRSPDLSGDALRNLVQHYAGGREDTIAGYLIEIYEYVRTLENAGAWMTQARAKLSCDIEKIRELELRSLEDEISRQIVATTQLISYLKNCLPQCSTFAEKIVNYRDMLQSCALVLPGAGGFDRCIAEIAAFDFGSARKPRGVNESDHQRAREIFLRVKKWYRKRLMRRFCLFSLEQWREGLGAVAPHVHTLLELIEQLDQRYKTQKNRRYALDFNDLEERTYNLLSDSDGEPSGVARTVQDKFRYVLVDEFQDINPIQDGILRLVSRASGGAPGNLFCVGDVKQCIYRFRMAEPEIFLRRIELASDDGATGKCFTLSTNFRSTARIIEAVNHICGSLISPQLAGIAYDENARLRHPGGEPCPDDRPAELHIVQNNAPEPDDDQDDEDDNNWEDIEKQACLMGQRILKLVREEGFEFGDIAVLLRAATRADQIASGLQTMGIPAVADATTGFFGAIEISDMLALLSALDNMQQDIPLASVMRSGVSGVRFSETEMLEVRRTRPREPFYRCVLRGNVDPASRALKDKLGELRSVLKRFRRIVRRRPLAEALMQVYQQSGYLSYVSGRLGGAQRRANLLMLHQRAHQFSTFRSQPGLHDFLRFIEKLRRQGQDLGPANPTGQTGTAVRIMTVHNSKGLQFPVVLLPNLEKLFNFGDIQRRLLYDRSEHIGLPVVDPQKRIRYPSWITVRAKQRIHRENLAEELRILYVALTRTKKRLLLFASAGLDGVRRQKQRWESHTGPLAELTLLEARCYLDWLLPAIACGSTEKVQWIEQGSAHPDQAKLFCVQLHERVDIDKLTPRDWTRTRDLRRNYADLRDLPQSEPVLADSPKIDALFQRIDFSYPARKLGALPSVLTVSEFKRRSTAWSDQQDDARSMFRPQTFPRPRFVRADDEFTSLERGTATHFFLQFLDYTRPEELAAQLQAMVEGGRLQHNEAELVDLDSVSWFLQTPLGSRTARHAAELHRELAFTSRISVEECEPTAQAHSTEDFIILRGMVDLLVPCNGGFEVVDFKTDRVSETAVDERAEVYHEQIRRYAMVVSGMWSLEVPCGHLVFLGPRRIRTVQTSA